MNFPLFHRRSLLRLATVVFLATVAGAVSRGADDSSGVENLKGLTLEQLTEVDVTSVSRMPEPLSEAASAIQVVSHEDIRRFGARTLSEALALANNLQVARKNSHDWGISARGFNTELANKLLVMIDGRTIYTPLFSGVRWDVQDYVMEDIDRIEVISGPGGTLWGANAVNGVINIITQSAAKTQGLFVEAGGGDYWQQGYSVRYGGTAGDVSYRVYAKYSDYDSDLLPSGADANDSWRRSQIGFRVDGKAGASGSTTLQGDYYRGQEDFVAGGTSDVSGGNVLGRWTQTTAGGSELSLQGYFDHTQLRQPVAASAFSAAGFFEDRLDTWDLDFQDHVFSTTRHQVVWGLGLRLTDDRTVQAPGLAFNPPQLRQTLYSAFLQDEITLGGGVSAVLGSKVEHFDYTGTEVEPTVRLQWKVNPGNFLWAAVSRAVRTPSRIDHDLVQPPGPITILKGGADFTSEKLTAYELGYRAQISSSFVGSASLFYNDYDDIRSAAFTPVTLFPLVFRNDVKGETHGCELNVTWQPTSWWRLTAGATFLRENLRVKAGQTDLNNALNETADPSHQASLRSSMDLPHGWEWDANLRNVGALRVNNVGQPAYVPGYTELDLRLARAFGAHWEVAVTGRNLLHSSHPEFGLPGPTQVQIRRSFDVTVTGRF